MMMTMIIVMRTMITMMTKMIVMKMMMNLMTTTMTKTMMIVMMDAHDETLSLFATEREEGKALQTLILDGEK